MQDAESGCQCGVKSDILHPARHPASDIRHLPGVRPWDGGVRMWTGRQAVGVGCRRSGVGGGDVVLVWPPASMSFWL